MAQHERPEKAIYRPYHGIGAVEQAAVGLEFLLAPPTAIAAPEGVACVHVCGPLAFGGFLFATYASIREQVRAALASDAHTVLLVFDSPGGDVDGCFDCARGLRADAQAAGKRLVGWVPSKVCSAAYALSTACETLYVAASAQVGSIGVIRELQSVVKQDAAAGVEYAFVVSGAKKALGNPHMPITDTTLAEAQRHVDATAELFFALVKEARGVNPEALEAAVFMGEEAVRRKLADEVTTLDALLAQLGSSSGARNEARGAGAIQAESASVAHASKGPMAKAEDKKDDKPSKDDMRASLQKAADGGDAKALRALKAYDEDEKDDKAKASDDDKKDGDDKAKAKAEFSKKDDEKDDKALAAASTLAGAVAAQATEIASLKASLAARDKRDADAERATFFASYAGLPKALLDSLKDLPLDQCKKIVASIPPTFSSRAITPEAGATRGDAVDFGSEAAKAAFLASPLAARMGVTKTEKGTSYDPLTHTMSFGVQKVKA